MRMHLQHTNRAQPRSHQNWNAQRLNKTLPQNSRTPFQVGSSILDRAIECVSQHLRNIVLHASLAFTFQQHSGNFEVPCSRTHYVGLLQYKLAAIH